MSKHTPGPWFMRVNRHRDTNGSKWGWVDSNNSGSQRPPAGVNVCWTEGETSHANARLISAAPELLESLEKLHAIMQKGGVWTIEDQKAAYEAIVKAKGEQG